MASEIPFIKMHGAENDYVFIDGFSAALPEDPESLARTVSNRHASVGSDGLVLLVPPADDRCDVEMRIRNADGSSAGMCGNAARCVAVWMQREGRVEQSCRIRIGERLITATDIHGNGHSGAATVDMGCAEVRSPGNGERLSLDGGATEFVTVHRIDVGNPHAVVFAPELSDELVRDLGPVIERHPELPDRTNVEFVVVESDHTLTVRVWERGSGETRSCGSGACAVATVVWSTDRLPSVKPCNVSMPGGRLTVTRSSDGSVSLSGPVSIGYTGILFASFD